jgi:hypothetical protein
VRGEWKGGTEEVSVLLWNGKQFGGVIVAFAGEFHCFFFFLLKLLFIENRLEIEMFGALDVPGKSN